MRSASARRRSLFTTLCVPLLACTALVTLDPAPPPASAASGVDIRVGSFNIQSVSLDGHRGQQRPWKQRRGKIIRQIMGERVAVIGLQEANPSKHFRNRLVSGSNQYLDLKNGLNRAGGHFAVANRHAYNCVRSSTPYKCRHKDRNASNGDRILYNTRKLRLLSVNAMKYSRQSSTTGLYLAWARFRSRANGHTFLFATTHLDPRNRSTRKAQWRQMIRKINHVKHGRPVIVVGDFNTQKFDRMAKSMLPAMKRAGYGDVLNQKYRVNPSHHVRARKRIHGWVNTANHLNRNVKAWSYEGAHRKTGNGIDYVFASNRLKVPAYKVVVDFDPRSMRVNGILPSDHNMIRATIRLP